MVTDLLTALRERGLDTTQPIFVGVDGGARCVGTRYLGARTLS